ncbi:hypothetical protein DYB28_006889 [Aphanomyces astaci]|uniref:EF-hand domain-containing protein n=1 Tax=Aphanomyces astaci TaxID=112090 RepID=A0A9X8DPG5_APHAT|nr:hypothetical protein DYB28_006889 [Aphanomyces astaci]
MGNSASVHDRCRTGDVAGLKELLHASVETADVEKVDEYGRTALLVAAGCDPVVKAPSPTPQQQHQLDGISERSESEAFPSIGSDTDPATGHSLSIAAQKKQVVVDMINLLVEKQANLDHRDEKGWTALHYACQAQNDAAVECLLKHGAVPSRDSLGLLPQDLLLHSGYPDSIKVAEDTAGILHRVTGPSEYKLKLLSLRSSGIAEIRLGGHIEKGSIVTVDLDVPANHSPKDYIQLLIYNESGDTCVELGPVQGVPSGATGQVSFKCDYGSVLPCIYRFVYVKCDINTISRVVVASGCTASVQASIGEVFQYELYLYDRVVEVESVSEYEFFDQPTIALKRIGIVQGTPDDIDWVDILPENHIVAVNDVVIAGMSFENSIRQLQVNNGHKCTKLLMQNSVALGDFIHEKILGLNVIGKYASLSPVDVPVAPASAPPSPRQSEDAASVSHDALPLPDNTFHPIATGSTSSEDFHDALSPSSVQPPASPLRGVSATTELLPTTKQLALPSSRELGRANFKLSSRFMTARRRSGGSVDPYLDLVRQLDKAKVSKQKQTEAMHDHRTIHTLGEDMSWLKKRKHKSYMRVKHKATHLKQVHKLLHEVDLNGDGTLSFDEFVDLLSQSDAKNVVHPLEKLVQMAQHGDLGVTLSDAALSLQTLIPSYQRKLMLESLMAYGDTTHSPRTRRELEVREANEAMLRRADIALHALDTSSAITKPARLPPMTVTTRVC